MLVSDCIKPSEVPPGSVLLDEFIKPLELTTDELSQDIGLPHSHVMAIVEGGRAIDADTAFRLARYFSTTEEFWLHLQMAYDLEQAKRLSGDEIARTITPRKFKGSLNSISIAL